MTELLATNTIASWLPEHRPTATLIACANWLIGFDGLDRLDGLYRINGFEVLEGLEELEGLEWF